MRSKEELKELRNRFQSLMTTELKEVKRTIAKIDQFSQKENEMHTADKAFKVETEEMSRNFHKYYQDQIESILLNLLTRNSFSK